MADEKLEIPVNLSVNTTRNLFLIRIGRFVFSLSAIIKEGGMDILKEESKSDRPWTDLI